LNPALAHLTRDVSSSLLAAASVLLLVVLLLQILYMRTSHETEEAEAQTDGQPTDAFRQKRQPRARAHSHAAETIALQVLTRVSGMKLAHAEKGTDTKGVSKQ
jgi:hypothetical protein